VGWVSGVGFLAVWQEILLSIQKSGKLINYVDVFAVCAPLAQAAGRWGNFFNKELFGYPTNLPWSIYVSQELRPTAFKYYDHFHPLFLYESLLDLSLFIVLYRLYHRPKMFGINLSNGFISMLYLVGYSVIRFTLELMRVDPWKVANFPVASIVSLAVFTSTLTLFFVTNIKANKR